MVRANKVSETTNNILRYYSNEDKVIIFDFLTNISTINILKLGTVVGEDLIAEYLFVDAQDVIMKFLINMLNVLREDKDFFNAENSYIKDLNTIIGSDIFNKDYCKLVTPAEGKEENNFNELLAIYIMCGVPSKNSVLGGIQ